MSELLPIAEIIKQLLGGIILSKENSTFMYLVIWCILVIVYLTIWKNNWFILISTNLLFFIKTYFDYRGNRKNKKS